MHIIVTGSLAFDQIMVFPDAFADHIMPDKLHVMSVSFLINHLHKNFGGTAGNISYNLGLLGRDPVCLASAGKDAEDYKVFLEKNGVNTKYITIIKEDYTGSFVLITDKKDCQIAGFYPGAMNHDEDLSIIDIIKKEKWDAEDCFAVLAPTTPEAIANNVKQLQENGVRYLFSPAQQIPRLAKEELIDGVEGAEIVVGNDYEIALLENKTGINKEEMVDKVKVVITTLGERGSVLNQKNREEIVIGTAKPRDVKDPTGSGDAYIAGFLTAYLDGKSLVECGQWGATAATYAVEAYGSTGHTYSLSIFENRLRENFG